MPKKTSTSPSVSQLKRALDIAEQIQKLEAELAGILGNREAAVAVREKSEPAAKKVRKKRRNMSPEARERIAAAQRARWAKARGDSKKGK